MLLTFISRQEFALQWMVDGTGFCDSFCQHDESSGQETAVQSIYNPERKLTVLKIEKYQDMIIRGGENIYPREVEEFLHTHPSIMEAQVLA